MTNELVVRKRNVFGKKVKKLREQNLIPAELYGRGTENLHLEVASKDLNNFLMSGESSMINLNLDGKKQPVLIYNLQRHPVTGKIVSIDFYQVRLDEKVVTKVPIELVGEAPAVKEKDGVLLQVTRELEVEALPTNIPRSIEVDISLLIDIDQDIFVRDLKVGENVKILAEPEAVVVAIQARMTEEEEKAMEAEAADIAEVKIEGEEEKLAGEEEIKAETENKDKAKTETEGS